MENGTYRLTQDVQNPKRDKRCNNSGWEAATYKTGTLFVYQEPRDEHDVPTLSMYKEYRGVSTNSDRYKALAPYLERLPESFEAWYTETWTSPGDRFPGIDVVQKLIDKGLLTLEQVKQAYAAVQKDWEDEWDRTHPKENA